MLYVETNRIGDDFMVKTYSLKKHGNKKITTNFVVREFACNDGTDTVKIDKNTVRKLQAARNLTNAPINVTSGYRTPTYNRKVGGATNSYHVVGCACDTYSNKIKPLTLAKIYELLGAKGIGYYSLQRFVHVDMRPYKCWWEQGKSVTMRSSFMTVSEIKEVQKLLKRVSTKYNKKLLDPGKIDGVIGKNTINSFRRLCNSKYVEKTELLKLLGA